MYMFDHGSRSMNPYLAGAIAGALAVVSVAITGKFFGASTTFARMASGIEGLLAPDHVSKLVYLSRYSFKVDWQFMFLTGIMLGAFLSSVAEGRFCIDFVPDMWREHFGESLALRLPVAFLGGVLVMFGARMAGGCPSGHGISGLMQLSLSGFVSVAAFFAGGLLVANLIYAGRRI